MKKYLLIILLVFAGFLNADIQQVNKNGDFQIWTYAFMGVDMHPEWQFQLSAEFRWGDDASTLYYKYLQGQILYKAASWIEIAPGYRQEYIRNREKKDKWANLFDPLMDVILYIPGSSWKLADRNRLEYLIDRDRKNLWLYRNRFLAISPWKADFLQLNPFFSNEIFFLQDKGFSQDRVTIGFYSTWASYAKLKTYYTWRYLKKKKTNWSYQNILALQLFLRF